METNLMNKEKFKKPNTSTEKYNKALPLRDVLILDKEKKLLNFLTTYYPVDYNDPIELYKQKIVPLSIRLSVDFALQFKNIRKKDRTKLIRKQLEHIEFYSLLEDIFNLATQNQELKPYVGKMLINYIQNNPERFSNIGEMGKFIQKIAPKGDE